MLKSKVKEVYDLKMSEVWKEPLVVEVSNKNIMNRVLRVPQKYQVIEEVYDAIKSGDIVAIELESQKAKYNKRALISVGKGYFDRELEDNLIGMKKDEVTNLLLHEILVRLRIVSIKRKIIPDITDELVKKEEIAGVNTIAEYKEHIKNDVIEAEKEMKLYEFIYQMIDEELERSEFELAKEDINSFLEDRKKHLQEDAARTNISYEEHIIRMASYEIDNPTIMQSEEFLYDLSVRRIKIILLGSLYMNKFNITLNQESYEKEMVAAAKRENITIEQMKQMTYFYDYLENKNEPFVKMEVKKVCMDKVDIVIKEI